MKTSHFLKRKKRPENPIKNNSIIRDKNDDKTFKYYEIIV